MITICIEYKGSSNLPVLLTQLQPQLHPDDDIYLVDTTPERKGLEIAKLYGSTRCYIFVEVGDYTKEQAFEFAEQCSLKNDQEGTVFLDENSIISATFIQNVKRAIKTGNKDFIYQNLTTPYLQMPTDFKWYYPSLEEEQVVILPLQSSKE